MIDGTVIVQLGRYGDIVNCLPIARRIFLTTGKKPHWMVSPEFGSIFDGVDYVRPVVLGEAFDYSKLDLAMQIARQEFKSVVQCQVYGKNEKGNYYVETKCDSYNEEQWRVAGFLNKFDDKDLQPVFDKRTPIPRVTQPIQVAFHGSLSSPFPYGDILSKIVSSEFGTKLNDLSSLRLEHIYDLLDFYDAAKVLVSIDTVHLHLAGASKVPLVAICNDGWRGTIPRTKNLVARLTYSQVVKEPQLVVKAIYAALAI